MIKKVNIDMGHILSGYGRMGAFSSSYMPFYELHVASHTT